MKLLTVIIFSILILPPFSQVYTKVVSDSVHGASLTNNLLDESPVRQTLIYLPPDYEKSNPTQYPVLYLLHSYGSHPDSWLGENGYEGLNIAETLDSLITTGELKAMIVVMPDTYTKFGGSWYTNSSTGGNWLDFIASDLVSYIDENYRTINDRQARGIAGQSMGGYGALFIAMNRPDVFGAVLAMSSPNLMNPDPFGQSAHEAALSVNQGNYESSHILARLLWSKAIAFSPNPESPPFYADLPFIRNNGTITRNQRIWQKWLDYALNFQVENHIESLRRLRIRLEVGKTDPLLKETRSFSNTLFEHNIEHDIIVFQGGHVEGVKEQFQSSVFQFFDEYFSK